MGCEHHKLCGDCFSPEYVARQEEEIRRLKEALFVKDDDGCGNLYMWCRNCDGDWDIGAPERHKPECPLFAKDPACLDESSHQCIEF